ncbi:MAG: ABC transporter ATP-binding protein [Candidatus Omnitrophica bacterium]|nr:ABC transporter ATP-binding protein [Candidatus Omnitrophota bacterium]
MEKVIVTKNLSKFYRNVVGERHFKALDNFSIEVEKGEIFGLLGPNGSGKTTLLKLLLGLIFQSGGDAVVLGKSPRDIGTKKRIGYLPEQPYFQDFLNPVELLYFYGSLFGIEGGVLRKRVYYLLEKVNLTKFEKMRIANFSKGMLQRIGLAISLINDPDLLFLDEPTLGLDPIGTVEINSLLRELNSQGKTIFLSSHLLSEVQDSCRRVAIVYKGRLIKDGSIDSLLTVKDALSVELTSKDEGDIEKLKRLAAECGLDVKDISQKRSSLKDLFIDLINAENK